MSDINITNTEIHEELEKSNYKKIVYTFEDGEKITCNPIEFNKLNELVQEHGAVRELLPADI